MTSASGSHTTRLALAALGLVVLYVVGVIVRHQFGVLVIVVNESGEAPQQVSVKAEGTGERDTRSDLYYLAPGGRARVYARPATESHISLEFMDARNKLHTQTVLGYVEAGDCGIAKATILRGEGIHTTSDPACWKSWFDFMLILIS